MKIFHFGGRDVARADILNANIKYDFADLQLFVDLEVKGGGIMSLNLEDSLIFMDEFIHEVRNTHNIS
ncbi:MAG: hypothetical protein ACK45E_01910 [Ignavibacteria bacterium]|jgi:hypothetical protein